MTDYSLALAEDFCAHIASGETVRAYCAKPGSPDKASIFRWLAKHPEFEALYSAAVTVKAHGLVDEMKDIADGKGLPDEAEYDAAKVRNQLSTRQWIAERTAPKKYGAKTGVELSGEQKIVVEIVQF